MFGLLRSQLQGNVLRSLGRTMAFYAVAKGRKVGVYADWAQCEQQVKGFKGAVYKKFQTLSEAEHFVSKNSGGHFKPDEWAVPLGQKAKPPASWSRQKESKKNPDFWPEDVAEENAVTEDDLMSALYEVEGYPDPSSSRKRKPDTDCANTSSSKLQRIDSSEDPVVALKHIGSYDFGLDADGYVIVYTDGSCLGNGRSDACAGFGVYFGDNHPLNAGEPVKGRVTNNVGEIQAAIYAIKVALGLGIGKLSIYTDSRFLINSITLWVDGWKKRGWRLKNNQPVKNEVDFKELDELLQNKQIDVKWTHVEAHKGIKGNEMADQLAKEGSQLHKQMQRRKT
ncbi:hypothetical protein KR222_007452 [Zaprionus bogoriensis]|nr:hypothetical protein KR222_007452 [Zaprionus bogoriensis]